MKVEDKRLLAYMFVALTFGLAFGAPNAWSYIGYINGINVPCVAGYDWCADGAGHAVGAGSSSYYYGKGQCGDW